MLRTACFLYMMGHRELLLFHYYSTAIIEHLVRNGVMLLEALYEPPFTDFHFEGLDGVLPDHADRVISIIKRVNENARAAA